MATIPAGGYPKMVTASDGIRTVPLLFPPGDAKQFQYVIFNSAADETAYAGNGITASSVAPATGAHGNSWQTGNWKKAS